jgi:Fe-S-cluster-containing dehydrogenase component
MSLDRRQLLQAAAATGAAAVLAEGTAEARVRGTIPPDAIGLLYDTTKCIGCKSCVVACRESNEKKPDRTNAPGGIWDTPMDLNGQTKNIIKLYKSVDSQERSYFKQQCMHCGDPACATACMIGALQKREHGIVTYDSSLCSGCRYCQMACPFGIPKFEWTSLAPKMVKCELCAHRAQGAVLAVDTDGFTRYPKGHGSACAEVCPRRAVISGKRDELLNEAKKRIAENPGRYKGFKDGDPPVVFGEKDAGGTQCLVLSHVALEKLGLPNVGPEAVPETQQIIQQGVYRGMIGPVALYGLLGFAVFRARRSQEKDEGGEA